MRARLPSSPDFEILGVVSLVWDEALRAVVVTWAGAAQPADFHALLSAELKALGDHQASRLLADCRRQQPLRDEDQDLADREWVPQALACGLRRFAVVLPDDRLAAINVEDRLGRVQQLEVGFFATVEAAERWLEESGAAD